MRRGKEIQIARTAALPSTAVVRTEANLEVAASTDEHSPTCYKPKMEDAQMEGHETHGEEIPNNTSNKVLNNENERNALAERAKLEETETSENNREIAKTTKPIELETESSLVLDPLRVLSIPANMVAIKRFTSLTLTHQSNATSLHPHFALFSNLQSLVLEWNRLTSLFHLLPPLREQANADNNATTTTESKEQREQLRESELEHKHYSSSYSSLSMLLSTSYSTGCHRLKELFLSHNCLTSLNETDIPRLRSLEILTLAHNQLSSLEETVYALRKLQQLRYLDMRENVFNRFAKSNKEVDNNNNNNNNNSKVSVNKHNDNDDGDGEDKEESVSRTFINNQQEMQQTIENSPCLTNVKKAKLQLNRTKEMLMYRYYVIYHLPQLQVLDRHEITNIERTKVNAFFNHLYKETLKQALPSKSKPTITFSELLEASTRKHDVAISANLNTLTKTDTISSSTRNRKVDVASVSECTKMLNKEYERLIQEQRRLEEAQIREAERRREELVDKYTAFHAVWTLSEPGMPLSHSDNNISSNNNCNRLVSINSTQSAFMLGKSNINNKRKGLNSAGSSGSINSSNHDSYNNNNHNNNNKLGRRVSKVKDQHASIENAITTATTINNDHTNPLTLETRQFNANENTCDGGISTLSNISNNAHKSKRMLSAQGQTKTVSSSSLSSSSFSSSLPVSGAYPSLLSQCCLKGQGNSNLPIIALPREKVSELLTPPTSSLVAPSAKADTNTNDKTDTLRVPCVSRLNELSSVIEPASQFVKSIRKSIKEQSEIDYNNHYHDKNTRNSNTDTIKDNNQVDTITTCTVEKVSRRSATNSANENNQKSNQVLTLTPEQVHLLQKIEQSRSVLIPTPWESNDDSTADLDNNNNYHDNNNSNTNTKNYNKNINFTDKCRRSRLTSVKPAANVNTHNSVRRNNAMVNVNKRDVILYALRAIKMLLTSKELMTLKESYGDGLLHRALCALAEDEAKKNAQVANISFERIFSGKPREIVPKSKNELRRQQKANTRTPSRNRHGLSSSISLRVGEALSEEEVELQRIREEEEKHMELFWIALTQSAFAPELHEITKDDHFNNGNINNNNNNNNNMFSKNDHSKISKNVNSDTSGSNNNSNNNNHKALANSVVKAPTPTKQRMNKKTDSKSTMHHEEEKVNNAQVEYETSMTKGTIGEYNIATLLTFFSNLSFHTHYGELDLNSLLHALITSHSCTHELTEYERQKQIQLSCNNSININNNNSNDNNKINSSQIQSELMETEESTVTSTSLQATNTKDVKNTPKGKTHAKKESTKLSANSKTKSKSRSNKTNGVITETHSEKDRNFVGSSDRHTSNNDSDIIDSDTDREDKWEEIDNHRRSKKPLLTINNLLCALCCYVPFVEQRLRFMQEQCIKCVSMLQITNNQSTNNVKSASKKANTSVNDNNNNNTSDNNGSIDYTLNDWFTRVSFFEEHIHKLNEMSKMVSSYENENNKYNSNITKNNSSSNEVCSKDAKQTECHLVNLDNFLLQPVKCVGAFFAK